VSTLFPRVVTSLDQTRELHVPETFVHIKP
jgi:hypothetical protein